MHLVKLPSGKWRVIVQHDGNRKSGTAPTKAGAQQLGATLLLELGAKPSDPFCPMCGQRIPLCYGMTSYITDVIGGTSGATSPDPTPAHPM